MLVTREAVLALMPHQTLTKMTGEPTHAALKKLEKELAANLIAVNCPWGLGHGYLGELLPPLSTQLATVLPTHLQPLLLQLIQSSHRAQPPPDARN